MRAVNLIPSEQRSGQPVGAGRSQGGAYAVLALVAGLALMAYLYGSAQHQVTSRRAHAAELAAQAQREQSDAERLAPYTSFIALRNERVQDVQTLVESRFDWAHVMHEFGRVLPTQASISSLSGTIGAATATAASTPATAASPTAAAASSVSSATPPGSVPSFTLAGCATSQSMVALTLERLRLIDGVKEVTLQSSTAGSGATSSGSGGCHASFTADVTFNPLPSASAIASATKAPTKAVSDPAGTGTSTTTTPSGVSAR
jgi:hypothetical protein